MAVIKRRKIEPKVMDYPPYRPVVVDGKLVPGGRIEPYTMPTIIDGKRKRLKTLKRG